MKKYGVWLLAAAIVLGGLLFYRRRQIAAAEADANPNASQSDALGYLASGYARETGAIADRGTSNERYNSYLDYLKKGGPNSGQSFDQYLTASEANSLPTNS